MLASPLYAAPVPEATFTKDIDSFNKLLPPAIEFIEGSSSGALAVPEGKYDPINATPKAVKPEVRALISLPGAENSKQAQRSSPPPPPPKSPAAAAAARPNTKIQPLHTGVIDTTWPKDLPYASGLYNSGNTCFLNSALQCLFHTPPLLRMLQDHHETQCRVRPGVFCMSCNLRKVTQQAYIGGSAFVPNLISGKLQVIAKHMRKGRQEDSHEFLRYAIDALQKSCLAGHPPKIDPLLAETTWVHKIFGGRLRSRVHCSECSYNSDTFDSILDLSLDIYNMSGLKNALRKFVAPDTLKGADKYKCERCKKPVIAEKRFSIHDAPMVLTVHLKRFTPMGRKIGNYVEYDDRLNLKPYMSEGQYGPTYSLYGVICHAGGGPNSGHYYAFVRSRSGKWCEMNDDSVDRNAKPPINLKNAYILFYIRDKGQGLDAAVRAAAPPTPLTNGGGVVAGMKKRKGRDENEEDAGVKVTKPFIGPVMPSAATDRPKPPLAPSTPDPQAVLMKKKIAAALSGSSSKALSGLEEQYRSDSDGEEASSKPPPSSSVPPSSSSAPTPSSPLSIPSPATPLPSSSALSSPAATVAVSSPATAVSVTSFYGSTPTTSHKRKHSDSFGGGSSDR
ncbi:Usp36 protein, partial [Mycena metata]